MSGIKRVLTCAALGAGVLIISAATASAANASAANASAAIVYRGTSGWHVHEKHKHPIKPVEVFFADDWRWGRTNDYHWRLEHGMRGYLRGNRLIWIEPSYLYPFSPPEPPFRR
jgi:hypothetical protein